MKKHNTPINKIIIFLPNWIGDAVLALPAVYRIREMFASARISVIGLPHISELFYEYPYINEIMVYPVRKTKTEILPAANAIRKGRFDLAVLFPNSLRSAMIARIAGIPFRCGYNKDGRGILLNIPIKLSEDIKKVHQSEYYLNIASAIEIYPKITIAHPTPTPLPSREGEANLTSSPCGGRQEGGSRERGASKLYLSKQEEQIAEGFLKKYNITPEDLLIGINPGAAYGSSKRWYPERYGSVARNLIRKYNCKIIIFGSQKEMDIANEIASLAEASVLNAAGKTSVRELMALINRCKILITNDSGPMHIAAALGIPVIAIFGSTDPVKSGPLGDGHIVIKKDVPCSPCFQRTCPTDLKCMDMISVEDVLDGVAKLERR